MQVYFREVAEPFPQGCGQWWYVELHGRWAHNCGPVAFAVVLVPEGDDEAKLLNLFTTDKLRRRGLATRLLEAISERWPKLTGTSTPEARAFYDSLEALGHLRHDGKGRYTSTPRDHASDPT